MIRMRRIFNNFIMAASLLLLLASCGTNTATVAVYSPTQIAEAIISAQDNIAQLELLLPNDEYYMYYLMDIYKIDADLIVDGAICYGIGMAADEISVFILSDRSNADDVKNALTEYIKRRADAFRGYAPEQTDILESSRVVSRGEYVAVLICLDSKSAEATFAACFSANPPAIRNSDELPLRLSAVKSSEVGSGNPVTASNDINSGASSASDKRPDEADTRISGNVEFADSVLNIDNAVIQEPETSDSEYDAAESANSESIGIGINGHTDSNSEDIETSGAVAENAGPENMGSFDGSTNSSKAGGGTGNSAAGTDAGSDMTSSDETGSSGTGAGGTGVDVTGSGGTGSEATDSDRSDNKGNAIENRDNGADTNIAPEIEAPTDAATELDNPDAAGGEADSTGHTSDGQNTSGTGAGTEENGNREDFYDSAAILKAWRSGDKTGLSDMNLSILNACSEIISRVTRTDMSVIEKETAINDWLVDWADYDHEANSNSPNARPDPNNENPYGLIFSKKAVCLGYTSSFQLFMDMLGIECITVEGIYKSTGEKHAWNMVRIDGNWYCVDVTWNDPMGGIQSTSTKHRYLNVTSQFMRDTKHEWDESLTPTADSGKLTLD